MSNTASITPAVKKLSNNITGYLGYEARDRRSITDKSFRRYLVRQVHDLLKHVNTLTDNITPDQNLAPTIDKLKRGILTVSEGFKYPTYLNSMFFLKNDINPELLNRLYECENHMLHDTMLLIDDIDASLLSLQDDEIESMIVQIQNFIDNFNLHQFERESMILE